MNINKITKSVMALVLGASVAIVGCDKLPTVDQMKLIAKASGVAAGTVMNMQSLNPEARTEIVKIMDEVKTCVPGVGESFEKVWGETANDHIQKLIDEKKIDATLGQIIEGTFTGVVCKGIDYVLNDKYPEARNYTDLVEATIHGFVDGFLTVFKSTNIVSATNSALQMDEDTYKYLLKANPPKL